MATYNIFFTLIAKKAQHHLMFQNQVKLFTIQQWVVEYLSLASNYSQPGLPWCLSWERILLQCGRPGFDPWFGKIPRRSEWLFTPVLWPGEFQGLYNPLGHKESDTTEQLINKIKNIFGLQLLSTIGIQNYLHY